MRLFILARHGESAANVAGVVSSDPAHGAALTSRGRSQARRLGAQIANLEIDLAVCTRFVRTRETAELALHGRGVPLLVEPDLDEINSGAFDGAPIRAYWAWRARHSPSERFPWGESLDEAVRRYAHGLQRVLAREEPVTLIVAHEHALRHIVAAAGRGATSARAERTMANALPYLLDQDAVRRATQCLRALAPFAARPENHHRPVTTDHLGPGQRAGREEE
jgi:broad specificity phosphatase PhoE